MCARYVKYKRSQAIRVALRVEIVAMHQSFNVKESVLIQQKGHPLYFK